MDKPSLVSSDSARLVILGLTCTAGREKVKCKQYAPLEGPSEGLLDLTSIFTSVFVRTFSEI